MADAHRYTFQGSNGEYLKSVVIGDKKCLQFSATDRSGDEKAFILTKKSDGYFTIKSALFGKYCRSVSDSPVIIADLDDAGDDSATRFRVDSDDNQLTTLYGVGKNMYCQLDTQGSFSDCLCANTATITQQAKMLKEEST